MRYFIACLFYFLASLAIAADHIHQCLHQAANYYGLPYELISAVARTESNLNPRAINKNRNGTEDIGLMQVNSGWLPVLKSYGILREHLWDPCVNAIVGAWILAMNVAQHGFTVNALGSYNTGSRGRADLKIRYARKVLQNYGPYGISSPSQSNK